MDSDHCERTSRRPMRAMVCTDYGPPDVLQLRDVMKPVPKDNDVLVRIRATTVSAADCERRRFGFAPWIWVPIWLSFGSRRPRQPVLGQELAGDVESVGKDVRSTLSYEEVAAVPCDVIFDVVRNTSSGCMVELLAENGCLLMANPGFSCRSFARGGRQGGARGGCCSRHRAERGRTWPTCEAWSKRDGCARSSTVATGGAGTKSHRPDPL